MANEDSILREVEQEIAEDRQTQMFRQYGPAFIGGAIAIVFGVAAWQFWTGSRNAAAEAQALEFRDAIELLAEDQDAGRAALGAVAGEGGGYGALAGLHNAASFARGGERLRAIEEYRVVYADGSAARQVRSFARLRAAYLSLADGRDAALADLGDLPEETGAFGVYAREIAALAALFDSDFETAQSMFRQLSIDIAAPQPLRARAEDFAALAATGKSGVNIFGEARVDDLLRAVGDGAADTLENQTPLPEGALTVEDAAVEVEAPAEPDAGVADDGAQVESAEAESAQVESAPDEGAQPLPDNESETN